MHTCIRRPKHLCKNKKEGNFIRSKSKGSRLTLKRVKDGLPFALPAVFGHILQWGIQAVSVVADVTVVTQQQAARIRGLAAGLAHCALQATPAFTEHHLSDLSMQQSHIQVSSQVEKNALDL